MEKNYTYEQLVGKIVRATMAIEELPDKHHTTGCPADDMTGHPAPCSSRCGADSWNAAKDKALRALKL